MVDQSTGNKYCTEHQNLEARDRERSLQGLYSIKNHGIWDNMYNSPKWKALKAQKLREQPLCEMCGDRATEVHHIRAHRGDWEAFLDPDNLMSICHSCHVKETAREVSERRKERMESRKRLWY